MKAIFSKLHSVKSCLSISIFICFSLEAKTTFIPRSPGDNTARELVGWQYQLFNNYCDNYAAIASSLEYTRSFKDENIAKRLFATSCLNFAGSQSLTRRDTDIVADHFGLATDFRGTLSIKPRIENVIIDLNFYAGLMQWFPGLYLRVHAPLVHTRWTLGLDSCLSCGDSLRGCPQFPPCYMNSEDAEHIASTTCIPAVETPGEPKQIISCPTNTTLHVPSTINSNCTAPDLRDALSGKFTFGDMTVPWNFGKFSFCPRSKTGLADIDISLGLNFIQTEWAHLGGSIVTVIPTGNRPKSHYIFEPVVGDGKHWHLGAGFSGHISMYPNLGDGWFNTGLYVDGRIVQVFKTDQVRSFDFKDNGLLSRYLLLKEFDLDGHYTGSMINAINFNTRNCEVSVGAQVDISAKVFFRFSGWEIDIGYNFFQRDREKICLRNECPCPLDSRIFGIKGVEGVCEKVFNVVNDIVSAESKTERVLNTTQENATIFKPLLPDGEPALTEPVTPPGTPTTSLSWNSKQVASDIPFNELTEANGFIGAQTNAIPVRVTCADLDISSAAQPRIRTNKIFGHVRYAFRDGCYCPHVGIGAEGEFDGCNNTLEQWGIWIKAGLSF